MAFAVGHAVSEEVAIFRGDEAWGILQNADFQSAWDLLYEKCSWATVFQVRQFATTWYDVYRELYEPLILCKWESPGEMSGLWALAVRRTSGQLVGCGVPQAEYYVWIALSSHDEVFLLGALRELRMRFPGQVLKLAFVPPDTPLSFAGRTAPEFRGTMVAPWARPLRLLSKDEVGEWLRKKSNKSRFNRLARTGEVEYRELTTSAELARHLHAVALFCNFRQGGLHGDFPFRDDPQKREFFLRLLDYPRLTYASVLTVGGELAAYHIGFRSRHEVTLGLLGHSPLLARHSPGKLLLLMITDALAREGMLQFDLTPGGEYKERFQNSHDTAYIVWFPFSKMQAFRLRIRRWAADRVKAALGGRNIGSHPLAGRLQTARKLISPSIVPKIARFVQRRIFSIQEMRFYGLDSALMQLPERGPRVEFAVNRIEDLLLYAPGKSGDRSLQRFLFDSARRLEEGQTVVTYVENGLLLHYAWVAPRGGPAPSGVGNQIALPGNSCVLWDDYTHPSARGRGLHKASIRARAVYARLAGYEHVYINVYADNAPSRKNIEASGFAYAGSMVRHVHWGRVMIEWLRGPATYGIEPADVPIERSEVKSASSPSN